jgi:hypothetical protein
MNKEGASELIALLQTMRDTAGVMEQALQKKDSEQLLHAKKTLLALYEQVSTRL